MAAKKNGHGRGALRIYKSYMFKEKDPAIDELRTVVEQHYGKRVNNECLSDIVEEGGPSLSCMRAWFFGDTRRPTNATLEAAGRAMGMQRVWRRMRENT